MTERTIPGGNFVPGTQEGDPGKLKYLHTPDWKGKTIVGGWGALRVDTRACPGCMFPDAKPGKWPHTFDERCKLKGITREHARQEQAIGRRIQ
jgi:hypothetical protein